MNAMNRSTTVSEQILIVDDVPANLDLLLDLLEPKGYELLAASSGEEGLRIAEAAAPSLILLDVLMPRLDGYEVCRRLKANPATAHIPVIFITARDEPDAIVEGFRAGGVDYVAKPFHPEEVLARLRAHLGLHELTRRLQARSAELSDTNDQLRREIALRRDAESARDEADGRLSLFAAREEERWGIQGFLGRSQLVTSVVEAVRRVQGVATSVLITGESGTGKELIARAIHFGGNRAGQPFVPVNCSAVPAELSESVFFGHRRGAFTGADRDRKGCFELAHRGTLFLDEVGDMPAALQAKLLRVLESGSFTAVGAEREQRADVRIVAATNVDLEQRVRDGRFRQDLYYRLARFTVRTPPLRERPEDIAVLAEHFVRVLSREMARRPPRLGEDALECLARHDFPGNVRELKNVIERALIESGGAAIGAQHLGLPSPSTPTSSPSRETRPSVADQLPLNLEAAERALIDRALSESGGNVALAARMLGVPRMRIYRRLRGGLSAIERT
jgi:DNA-binding NtrC family response regulator